MTLNVYLGGDSKISKDSLGKFFHNLSMEALSRSNDRIQLKFTNINLLDRTILDNLLSMKLLVGKDETERIFRNSARFSDTIVSKDQSSKFKIESSLVNAIFKDEKIEFPNDDEFYTFTDTLEKMKKDGIEENELLLKSEIKN